MEYLYEKLMDYSRTDYYGFHMPGHKRNKEKLGALLPYSLDITEIDGFDDLHHAKDVIKDAQDRAAHLYHADESYYLVNGSTSGLLSAIMGCLSKGDQILVGRNCHKSVYHAVYMNELNPVYIYPKYYEELELNGPIDVTDVRRVLKEHRDIKAVVITSPTYDGIVSDVKAISEVAHHKGIPLIVDEAHGAHFGFHPYFPDNSNVQGADVVIHSLHKTLPALTQSALIHINGILADRAGIRQYLHMTQTSSPSYILMAGMDECIRLLSENGSKCFDAYVDLLERTRKRLRKLKHLKLVEAEVHDRSKIIISVRNTEITSRQLYNILLHQYHLQMEMAAGSYILAMTSICDTDEGMKRLVDALEEIDSRIEFCGEPDKEIQEQIHFSLPELEQLYTSAEVGKLLKRENRKNVVGIPWSESEGRVSIEYAYIYPPGIPLVVPGEVISKEAIILVCKYKAMGFSMEGPVNEGKVEVLVNGQDLLYYG